MQYVVLGLQICVGVKSITNLFCVACTKIEFKSEYCLTRYYKCINFTKICYLCLMQ